MLPSFCRQTVYRIRAKTKTSRGSTIPDWENPDVDPLAISGCSVQPASTSLSEDGRVLGVMDGLTAYLPEGSDVKAGDHIMYDGQTYEINGEPRVWVSATGGRDHILLNLRRYSG